jgi:hypothetical protein
LHENKKNLCRCFRASSLTVATAAGLVVEKDGVSVLVGVRLKCSRQQKSSCSFLCSELGAKKWSKSGLKTGAFTLGMEINATT